MTNSAAGQPPVVGQALPLYFDISFPILQHPNSLLAKEDNNDRPLEVSLGKVNYAELVKDSTPPSKKSWCGPTNPNETNSIRRRCAQSHMDVGGIIGKFSYGWPELDDLRVQIPKQLQIK
ncbi:hypothetical protein H5410_046529 [Solanum commersonii]|uniref:Uncharacterized protein n=1 Tax=Solanum commersonii TaxID=4109 RepID=A0A9J5XEP0_SOLCO|nr:hypothetical protein H5410_046529 [Solanum commersonii]